MNSFVRRLLVMVMMEMGSGTLTPPGNENARNSSLKSLARQ
jgi:hypothetical protein